MASAKLHHTDDRQSGLTRKQVAQGFVFYDRQGRKVKSRRTVARCEAIGIPPAYGDVWISADPKGHLQATARDDRGRKQYFYHPDWVAHRDATKFEQLLPFAGKLGIIRRHVQRDLRLRGMPKERVVAAIVKLLDTTYVRIGNEEYARENKSYGLTTLLTRHLRGRGTKMQLVFKGKSGVMHEVPLEDKRVRKIVAACQDLPGQELFMHLDDRGESHHVTSGDVNAYLRAITQTELTAKDFRTWHGTVLVAAYLLDHPLGDTQAEGRRTITAAITAAARALGNTVAVCRKCYIHPKLLECYLEGKLSMPVVGRLLKRRYPGLYVDELKLVSWLERW